jgi:hypothetical protein
LVERNLTTVETELIDEGGDLIMEYRGVQYDKNGKLQMINLGQRNFGKELRDASVEYIKSYLDFLGGFLLPMPFGPAFFNHPSDLKFEPPMGYSPSPNPGPSPSPSPAPTPEPVPPMPIPDPVVTKRN